MTQIFGGNMAEKKGFYQKGIELYRAQYWPEALSYFDDAMAKKPSAVEPSFLLACVLVHLNRQEEAICILDDLACRFPKLRESLFDPWLDVAQSTFVDEDWLDYLDRESLRTIEGLKSKYRTGLWTVVGIVIAGYGLGFLCQVYLDETLLSMIPLVLFIFAAIGLRGFQACFPISWRERLKREKQMIAQQLTLKQFVALTGISILLPSGIALISRDQIFPIDQYLDYGLPWFITYFLIMALWEEIAFRQYLFGWLYQTKGRKFAYIISSVVFSLSHLDIGRAIFLALLGAAFAWVYEKRGGLVLSTWCHFVYNISLILVHSWLAK